MNYIVGIVGVPGQYGGFETLVDYLLDSKKLNDSGVTVFCEKRIAQGQNFVYKGAKLSPIPLRANGWQSVFFDLVGILTASFKKADTVLILGTSATFILPLIRFFNHRTTYIVNMAGLEWSRSKWGTFARWYLKFNEMIAAKYSHKLICDNEGLKDYINDSYDVASELIPYGGDQILKAKKNKSVFKQYGLPEEFDFAMARAQIDNNMECILDAYVKSRQELVFVSNWKSSKYGQEILRKYRDVPNLKLIGPIYDVGKIKALYSRTRVYIHGHSAGGTNPVLVESMWAKLPVLAFDVTFNRYTTHNQAFYFKDSQDLADLSRSITNDSFKRSAESLFQVANKFYRWQHIQSCYESVILNEAH